MIRLDKKWLIFAVLMLATHVLFAPLSCATDWPMFGHDPQHTGVAGESVEPPLELLWKFKTNSSVPTYRSSPVISSDTVYRGSSDGHVYALDAATGTEKWKCKIGGAIWSFPAVSGDTLYIGAEDQFGTPPPWYLYALDVSTGTEKWKCELGVDDLPNSPTVSGGAVYISIRRVGCGSVYALDAATGTEKWEYKAGGDISSSPTVSGDTVYIGSWDNYIYALNALTGAEKWKYKTGDSVLNALAVSGSTVYTGSRDNYVYALDADTGAEKWTYETGDMVVSSPAVAGDTVYIGSTDDHVYALDADTGAEKWKYETSGRVSSPAVAGCIVYISSDDNYVYAFAPATTTSTPTPAPTSTPIPTPIRTSTPAPTTGFISVSSAPSGADIYLDGAYKGTTPTTIPDVSSGAHALKLEKYGYEGWLTSVHVTSGVTESITAHLALADVSPPAIRIDKPVTIDQNNNGLLEEGEKVEITYGANDPGGVASIKLLLDGALLESQNKAGTYTVTTNSLLIGTHTIRVEATDSKSNSCFEEVCITVERTGPSVYFGTTRTAIKKGEDAIFTLSAVNPIGNPLMTVQLILKSPSCVSVTGSSFAKAGAGIYTCTQAIESGDNVRSIEMHLLGGQVGTHEIASEVYYQFEGSP
ncbi:MAG: PQQ-binding-like beta-propeller repeat protein, partial [Euryarchaeota archaeon]|nr:PQQ-binding-like beta-propeller repeat protein [Euryarchaeota archaeon]